MTLGKELNVVTLWRTMPNSMLYTASIQEVLPVCNEGTTQNVTEISAGTKGPKYSKEQFSFKLYMVF